MPTGTEPSRMLVTGISPTGMRAPAGSLRRFSACIAEPLIEGSLSRNRCALSIVMGVVAMFMCFCTKIVNGEGLCQEG